jgi:hypothetical protein
MSAREIALKKYVVRLSSENCENPVSHRHPVFRLDVQQDRQGVANRLLVTVALVVDPINVLRPPLGLAPRGSFEIECEACIDLPPFVRQSITGIAGCCARAASGHAAAPPISVKNSRRLMCSPQAGDHTLPHCRKSVLCITAFWPSRLPLWLSSHQLRITNRR